jgi:hypothetical protein
MRESVTYQDILEQGVQKGILQRLISRRFGELEPQVNERIQRLAIFQLEDLGEALLDFSNAADLAAWLQLQQIDESSTN